jgi:hypothetical protein
MNLWDSISLHRAKNKKCGLERTHFCTLSPKRDRFISEPEIEKVVDELIDRKKRFFESVFVFWFSKFY